MKLTFLGTGTSQGVPMIGCHCEVCRSVDPRDQRLRCSAMVEVDGQVLIIDTSMDFRQQMLREGVEHIDAVLYTHNHRDHTGGMDDLRGYNYIMKCPIDAYCEQRVADGLHRCFDYAFSESPYPGVPEVTLHIIDDKPFCINGLEVIPIRGIHLELPVLGFKIGELCYLTDMKHISNEELEKIKGVKVLVINALRRKEHISHFSLDEALAVIAKVRPERAFLTHISHQLGFYNDVMRELPIGVELAYDGLKVEI